MLSLSKMKTSFLLPSLTRNIAPEFIYLNPVNDIQTIQNKISDTSGEIVMYQPDETIRLEVRLGEDTVWLSQQQMAELFQKDQSVIARHVKNVFTEGELDEKSNMQILHNTKYKYRPTKVYNLDVIISVGYRVKSKRGTLFRQWANKVLKDYLLKGYSVNKRFEQLEQRVSRTEEKIDFFVRTSLPPQQGIFFDGQVFDAYRFVSDLVRKAKHSITLIDNYVDDSVLSLLDKRAANVEAIIYTQHISKQLQLDIERHNSQYPAIIVKQFNKAHDRFLLIDEEVYHIGASIKDLGKKWFAFTLMRDLSPAILTEHLGNGSRFTPPYRLKSLLSTRYVKTAFSLMRGGKAAVWLGLVLLCLFSSCSKDDEVAEYNIEDLYEESKTLQYQTADSVEAFTYKFNWYLEAHPDAQDHPYYSKIDDKIEQCISGAKIKINSEWDGETHLEY